MARKKKAKTTQSEFIRERVRRTLARASAFVRDYPKTKDVQVS